MPFVSICYNLQKFSRERTFVKTLIWLNLLVIFLASAPHTLLANPKEKALLDNLNVAAMQSLQEQNFKQTAAIAQKMIQLAPEQEQGYQIAALAFSHMKRHDFVVAIVQKARMNGVESLFLYKQFIHSIYFLGGFSSTLQGFNWLEQTATNSQ